MPASIATTIMPITTPRAVDSPGGLALRSIFRDARSCESWSRCTGTRHFGRSSPGCKAGDLSWAVSGLLRALPASVAAILGDRRSQVGHVEHAEARAGLVAAHAGVEPVVASRDVDDRRLLARAEAVLEPVEHRVPQAQAARAGRLRDQRADPVELRRDEAGAAETVDEAAVFGRLDEIARDRIRVERDAG